MGWAEAGHEGQAHGREGADDQGYEEGWRVDCGNQSGACAFQNDRLQSIGGMNSEHFRRNSPCSTEQSESATPSKLAISGFLVSQSSILRDTAEVGLHSSIDFLSDATALTQGIHPSPQRYPSHDEHPLPVAHVRC